MTSHQSLPRHRRQNEADHLALNAFLKKEGIFEDTQAQVIKEVVAWQLAEAMKQKNISKNKMATLLKTSRT